MFTAALLTITKTWKPPTKCLSIDEWIMKMCCVNIHTHTDTHTDTHTHTHTHTHMGLPRWLSGKESTCNISRRRCGFDPWVRKIPWRRAWQPTPVFLPRESQRQRTWWATVHRVANSQAQLKPLSTHIHIHTWNITQPQKKILSLAATCLNLKDYHTK